jgi:nicotinamide-nucleotide amidase
MSVTAQHALAGEILRLLDQTDQRLVCAESCTAGLISATLAGIPGASLRLCGSAVVYRNATKTGWLGIPQLILDDPTRGDVCEETAAAMAHGVLLVTPEATVSVSVTGHLGPGSPQGLDGVVYLGWARRDVDQPDQITTRCERIELQSPTPLDSSDILTRVARQEDATLHALLVIQEALAQIVRESLVN